MYGVREAFIAIPLTALGQSEVNWHLLPSASPLPLCLHTLVVTEISIYLLNKVYSGFCLYSFSCLFFGISSGSSKEFEKKRAREEREN